jgi:hypothetical protein
MRHMRIDPSQGPGDEHVAWPEPACVRDCISKPVVTVSVTAPLTEAPSRMADHCIHYSWRRRKPEDGVREDLRCNDSVA